MTYRRYDPERDILADRQRPADGYDVGVKVYVLRDAGLGFRLYQIEASITAIEMWPAYPRGTRRAYRLEMADGSKETTWHFAHVGLRNQQVIRRKPFPDVPIVRTREELAEVEDEREAALAV